MNDGLDNWERPPVIEAKRRWDVRYFIPIWVLPVFAGSMWKAGGVVFPLIGILFFVCVGISAVPYRRGQVDRGQWFLMAAVVPIVTWVVVLFLFLPHSPVESDGVRTMRVRNVTYRVPWEDSSKEEVGNSFTYKGESVMFSDVGGNLSVYGLPFGRVSAGDVVSFEVKGQVLVNGVERKPVIGRGR